MILNITQLRATKEQIADGIVEPSADDKVTIERILTFEQSLREYIMPQVLMLFVIEDDYKMFVFPEDSVLAGLAKAAHGYTVNVSEDLENAEAMSMVKQLSDYPNELSDDYPVIYDFAPYEVKMAECVDLKISVIYYCDFAV